MRKCMRKMSSLTHGERYTHGHHKAVASGFRLTNCGFLFSYVTESTRFHSFQVNQHRTRTSESCASYLVPLLRSDHKLLDIGCGPGSISIGFCKYVESVDAVDNSSSVLSMAKEAA